MLTRLTMDALKLNTDGSDSTKKQKPTRYESFSKIDSGYAPDTTPRYSSLRDRIEKEKAVAEKRRAKTLKAETGNKVLDSMSLIQLRARSDLGHDISLRKKYHQRVQALAALEAFELTEKLKANRREYRAAKRQLRLEQRGALHTESREVGEMNTGSVEFTDYQENVRDHTGEHVEKMTTLGTNMHSTENGSGTQYSLDKFFERPISIYDATWNSLTEYNVPLKVWNLWSLDPSVRAKLSNYAYFKGKLHIKIATTGTPYHYGRIMASYQPYAKYNQTLISYDKLMTGTLPTSTVLNPLYKCYMSQAPGCGYIDVKENKPLELEIPFISHKSKFRLFNDSNTVITNATEFVDFEEAGELRLITLNMLKVANDDFDSDISINVYAWVSDIELGNITATDINITAQSREIFTESSTLESSMEGRPLYSGEGSLGSRLMKSLEVSDEYNEPGPIATVASAVAKAGTSLKDVPVIGPFARATSTVARAVSRIASLFGWSKPAVISDPVFVKNLPFQNGAVTVGKETIHKITLDPKQELTVDQTMGGVTEDQMSISAIAGRESFLTTFTWADDDAAMTDNLWKCLVTPSLFQYVDWTVVTGYQSIYQPTPLMFASQPFSSWRGKIKFRFEIVCSKFHRGKILFKYDPNVAMNGLISTNSTRLNQQNTVILDIQDAQDITFEIDWAHVRDWATCTRAPLTPPCPTENSPNPVYSLYPASASNGFIEVRALNELVQPTNGAFVFINVYVSCEDLQVNKLVSENMPTTRSVIHTESKEVSTEVLNETGSKIDDTLFLNHYGERIFSFRQLMKRYVTTASKTHTNTINGNGIIVSTGTLYPENGLPYDINGSNPQTITSNPLSLFSYLRYAFLGIRGGYRFRVIQFTQSDMDLASYTRVKLLDPAVTTEDRVRVNTLAMQADFHPFRSGGQNDPIDSAYANQVDGGILYHHGTNGGIEFEIPFYNKNIFLFSFSDDYGSTIASETDMGYYTKCESWKWDCAISAKLTNGDHNLVVVDSATAEDFTFLRFQGAPFYSS